MGKINGIILSLIRIKPSKCILSEKVHENENAFLIIYESLNGDAYCIRFGCFRYCHTNKTMFIAFLHKKDYSHTLNPIFDVVSNPKLVINY